MAEEANKITLKSSDGEEFVIDEVVAAQSQTLKNMIDDDCADSCIPIPNVTAKILSMVIEYCKHHVEPAPGTTDEVGAKAVTDLRAWDADFVKVDNATLIDIILASNYLNIKSLLELTSQTIADILKGKSVQEVRDIFGIQNDFTAEEEAELKKNNQWAFE